MGNSIVTISIVIIGEIRLTTFKIENIRTKTEPLKPDQIEKVHRLKE